MSIESALKQWIVDYSGVANVVQAPFAGKRPAEPFVTFQPTAFDYSDFDDKRRVSKDANYVTHNYDNWAKLLVSVHSYGGKAYDAINNLRLSMLNWQARNLLSADNLALNSAGANNNLTALEQIKHRPHWQADFEFNILITSSIDINKIKTWMLSGKWTDDDNITINSTIKYP
jgi:hypothetical protein